MKFKLKEKIVEASMLEKTQIIHAEDGDKCASRGDFTLIDDKGNVSVCSGLSFLELYEPYDEEAKIFINHLKKG